MPASTFTGRILPQLKFIKKLYYFLLLFLLETTSSILTSYLQTLCYWILKFYRVTKTIFEAKTNKKYSGTFCAHFFFFYFPLALFKSIVYLIF